MSDEPDVQRPETARFVSLKWKVGLIVSLVLVVVNSLITLVAYRQSNQQFNQQKLDLLRQQQRTISGLLQRDYEQLNSLAGFIPLLSSGAPGATGARYLQSILERHSALLGLEWGIASLSFVDPAGRLGYSWPDPAGTVRHRQLARRAAASDAPAGRVDCLHEFAPLCKRFGVAFAVAAANLFN